MGNIRYPMNQRIKISPDTIELAFNLTDASANSGGLFNERCDILSSGFQSTHFFRRAVPLCL